MLNDKNLFEFYVSLKFEKRKKKFSIAYWLLKMITFCIWCHLLVFDNESGDWGSILAWIIPKT